MQYPGETEGWGTPKNNGTSTSCSGKSCSNKDRWIDSYASPDFSSGSTWEDTYQIPAATNWDPVGFSLKFLAEDEKLPPVHDAACDFIACGPDGKMPEWTHSCGSTIGGSTCPDEPTAGRVRAQETLASLDPSGVLSVLLCMQSSGASHCGQALATAVPIIGLKGFKGGKILLDGIEGLPKGTPSVIEVPNFPKTKTASQVDGKSFLSGYSTKFPKKFDREFPASVQSEFPNILPHHWDNNGGMGAYYLSHAEKQAYTHSPGSLIVVTRPMCQICFRDFTAKQFNTPQLVLDPNGLHVFGQ